MLILTDCNKKKRKKINELGSRYYFIVEFDKKLNLHKKKTNFCTYTL